MIVNEIYGNINWQPRPSELRRFGWAAGAALVVLGLVFGLEAGTVTMVGKVLWAVAAALILLGTAMPALLFWIYRVWMAVTAPVAFLVQVVLLSCFFYIVLAPVSVILRLAGRDVLRTRPDTESETFWVCRKPQRDPRRYFRLY